MDSVHWTLCSERASKAMMGQGVDQSWTHGHSGGVQASMGGLGRCVPPVTDDNRPPLLPQKPPPLPCALHFFERCQNGIENEASTVKGHCIVETICDKAIDLYF